MDLEEAHATQPLFLPECGEPTKDKKASSIRNERTNGKREAFSYQPTELVTTAAAGHYGTPQTANKGVLLARSETARGRIAANHTGNPSNAQSIRARNRTGTDVTKGVELTVVAPVDLLNGRAAARAALCVLRVERLGT